MDTILQMILEIVREQQRDAASLSETMTKAEVVDLTISMMEQQGIDEYHEDLEADIYNRIQYLAPRLFEHETSSNEEILDSTQKYNYRERPTQEILDKNENLALDVMIGDGLQDLTTPVTIDTVALDYEQAYETTDKPEIPPQSEVSSPLPTITESSPNLEKKGASDTFVEDNIEEKKEAQTNIDEETLNQLVLQKYQELYSSGSSDGNIDSTNLAALVMQALQNTSTQETSEQELLENASEDVDALLKEIWSSDSSSPKEESPIPLSDEIEFSSDHIPAISNNIITAASISDIPSAITSAEILNYPKSKAEDVPVKKDILSGFYSTKSYITAFTDYLETIQENKKLDTGFSSLDRILETGLHSGVYLLHSDSIDLSSFSLQMADQISSLGFPVCYFLLHRTRYECMAKSLSRLTYELREKNKNDAISLTELYKKKNQTELSSLETELSYYEKTIAPNLYFAEGSFHDITQLQSDLQVLFHSFENQVGKKPIFILDDFYHCEEKEALLSSLIAFCSETEITLFLSLDISETSEVDKYSKLLFTLADLPTQDSFTKQQLLLEAGEALAVDVCFTDATSKRRKRCQLLNTPKYYFFESR